MNQALYSPRPVAFALPETAGQGVTVPARNLAGSTVGIVDNGKLLALGEELERELRTLGAKEVVRFRAPRYTELASADFLDAIAGQVEGAVVGLGN